MKNTVCIRINAAFRLIASSLFFILITGPFPAYAGLAEGLAAYDRADYAAALRELAPLAEKGDAAAQYRLGRMASLGQGVPRDPE